MAASVYLLFTLAFSVSVWIQCTYLGIDPFLLDYPSCWHIIVHSHDSCSMIPFCNLVETHLEMDGVVKYPPFTLT